MARDQPYAALVSGNFGADSYLVASQNEQAKNSLLNAEPNNVRGSRRAFLEPREADQHNM